MDQIFRQTSKRSKWNNGNYFMMCCVSPIFFSHTKQMPPNLFSLLLLRLSFNFWTHTHLFAVRIMLSHINIAICWVGFFLSLYMLCKCDNSKCKVYFTWHKRNKEKNATKNRYEVERATKISIEVQWSLFSVYFFAIPFVCLSASWNKNSKVWREKTSPKQFE